MENKNNGKGIFYGVIGVATLIVAIIGATFAYFTATAGSNDAINVTSMENPFEVTLSVSQVAPSGVANHLLPLDDSKIETAMKYTNPCLDENGDQTCAIYKLTLDNQSATASYTINGSITSVTNGFVAGHIKYQLFTESGGTYTAVSKPGSVPGVPTPGSDNSAKFQAVDTTNDYNITITAGSTQDLYLVIWLTDTGAVDQNDDQDKSFVGQITFADAVNTDTKITANFSAGS